MYTKSITTFALAGALVVGGAAAPALAKSRVVKSGGACATGVWKLKAKADNGRLDVEAEIDTNRNGQVWRVRVFDNGTRVVNTTRTTHAPSGSFSVSKLVTNRAGSDALTLRATNVRTGKVCGGRLTY